MIRCTYGWEISTSEENQKFGPSEKLVDTKEVQDKKERFYQRKEVKLNHLRKGEKWSQISSV